MLLKLEESYEGEFDELAPLQLLEKWEEAAAQCQCQVESKIRKALGLPEQFPTDGSVDGIDQLINTLTKAYELRQRQMIQDMVESIRKGVDHGSEILKRSHDVEPGSIFGHDELLGMLKKAFSSVGGR
jgi:hypothetical protein